jgi:hypothetical protein
MTPTESAGQEDVAVDALAYVELKREFEADEIDFVQYEHIELGLERLYAAMSDSYLESCICP